MIRINDVVDYPELCKNFPHVAKKLYATWGTRDFVPTVDSYLLDTRNGTRKGFPNSVGCILLNMVQIHDKYH